MIRCARDATLLLCLLAQAAAQADPYSPAAPNVAPPGAGGRYPLPPPPQYGGVIANPSDLPPPPRLTAPAAPPQYAPPPTYAAPTTSPPAYAPPPGYPPQNYPLTQPGPALIQQQAATVPQGEEQSLFKPAQIVATVGNQYVFYGDVLPMVNQMLEGPLSKATSDAERAEIESYREQLTKQATRQLVDSKLLYMGFMREVENKTPKDKLVEQREKIEKSTRESFQTTLAKTRETMATAKPEEIRALMQQDPVVPRLALLMKEKQIETMVDLDAELRRFGSSLQKQQRAYREYNLGRYHLGNALKERVSTDVTHQEMLDFYKGNAEKYGLPAKARFEILTVKFSSFPTREEARRKLAAMGNEVFLGGAPFAAVAKRQSEEPNAPEGGYYDWTTKDSLASEVINNAIFTLPIGQLSQVLEDERGCHIVRVIERQDAGYIPFLEAQESIKKEIVNARRQKVYLEVLKEIQSSIVVTTIYDDADSVAQQQGAGEQRR